MQGHASASPSGTLAGQNALLLDNTCALSFYTELVSLLDRARKHQGNCPGKCCLANLTTVDSINDATMQPRAIYKKRRARGPHSGLRDIPQSSERFGVISFVASTFHTKFWEIQD